MNLPGQLLEKYTVVQQVGHGGMGVVYLAIQKSINRRVAIKLIPPNVIDTGRLRERFRREVDVMSRLSHPNIVTIIECEHFADGSSSLVMEYVEGSTLAQLLNNGRISDWRLVTTWGMQIASALQHAHQRGVIHRDIKPENVMITNDNHIKVMDFGIARASDASNLTMDHVVGTPSYMSPEQASGKRVDARSDLYSFGCLLYALLSGHPPFGRSENENPMSIIQQQIKENPVLLSTLAPATPERLVLFVHRLLAKAPEDRFQDCQEVINGLESIGNISDKPLQKALRAFRQLKSLPARFVTGDLTTGDLCLLDLIVPGTSLLIRKRRIAGTTIFVLSIFLFLLPYPFTSSIALRIAAAVHTFRGRQHIGLDTLIEHLWSSKRMTLISSVLIMTTTLFGAFVWETLERQSRDTSIRETATAPRVEVPIEVTNEDHGTDPGEEATAPPVGEDHETVVEPDPTPIPTPEDESVAMAATPSPTLFEETPAPEGNLEEDSRNDRGEKDKHALPVLPALRLSQTAIPDSTMHTSESPAPDETPPLSEMPIAEIAEVSAAAIKRADIAQLRNVLEYLAGDDTDDPEKLMLRGIVSGYLSMRDRENYRTTYAAEVSDWKDDVESLRAMEEQVANSPEAGRVLITLGIALPNGMTSRILRFHRFSRYIDTQEEYAALRPSLESEETDEVYAALVLLSDSKKKMEGPEVGALLTRTFDPPEMHKEIRTMVLDALEANPSSSAIPYLKEARAKPSIVYGDHARIDRLINLLSN